MIRVEVQYSPRLTPSEKELLALPNRLRGLRPLMQQAIAPAATRMLERHWDSKGAAFGHRWAPWALSTLIARLRKGNAGKGLMDDTGHLREVLLRPRATDNRLRAIAGGIRLALNVGVPYAKFHQFGTKHMPVRQVIPDPLPRSFQTEVKSLVRGFILSGRIGERG